MILGDPNRPPQPGQQPKPEMAPPFCAKCDGEIEMQLGFIPDNTHGGILEPEWAPGQAEHTFWGGIQASGRRYNVRTYRCPECGYLESYAPSRWE